MNKSFISILIGLLIFGAGGQAWAGSVVAADLNCTNPAGCVQTNEISDGAVTEPKLATGAITNGKIADGAVTNSKIATGAVTTATIANGAVSDAKLTGPISATKIEKPANVVVVAKSGGDFTSIQAAIDSISPSAENPYLIKVMPGTYIESITMKSYVHLHGAGYDMATIQAPSASSNVISLNALVAVTISDLSIIGGKYGIGNLHSSPTIRRNKIAVNDVGIWHWESSSIISDNVISNNRLGIYTVAGGSTITQNSITGNTEWSIWEQSGGSATIKDNIISGNGGGIIVSNGSSPNISENNITENISIGISIGGEIGAASATIYRNAISSNGLDIYVGVSGASISFNIYDTIKVWDSSIVGMYNVKSDGSPVSMP